MSVLTRQINLLVSDAEDKLKELGKQYRANIILPFCKKHQAIFNQELCRFYYLNNPRIPIEGECNEENSILMDLTTYTYIGDDNTKFKAYVASVNKEDL